MIRASACSSGTSSDQGGFSQEAVGVRQSAKPAWLVGNEENSENTAGSEDPCYPDAAKNRFVLSLKSLASMISFNSMSEDGNETFRTSDLPGNKVDVLYSLLSILSSHDRLQSSQMLLTMSQDKENCQLIRGSGCMSLLVQLLHPTDLMPLPPPAGEELEVIQRASEALRNLVRFDDDEERMNRECVVLSLAEHVRNYVLHLRLVIPAAASYESKFCEEAIEALATLVQLSYREEQRRSMCTLGALQCISEALILDEKLFGESCPPANLDLRRVIGMALTNLTYGASETKRLLCSNGNFLRAVNAQIQSQPEELKQFFACVVRNLSWKTDSESKLALKEAGTVEALMRAAMDVSKETTLKSVLSALWNLSYHCSENKARICAVPSALEFLVKTLAYRSPTGSVAVVESCGGILRNISSHISLKEEYRAILRQHNCFQILLEHLESSSLTIVSNACGTLWNLSAHNNVDQKALHEMGAESKLRDLVNSKHKIISWGSAATLKNLLSYRSMNEGGNATVSPGTMGKQRSRRMATDCSCSNQTNTSPFQRRATATEIAAMFNDVARTCVMKPTVPLFTIASTSPNSGNENVAVARALSEDAPSRQSLAISASYSSPSSKEEQVQLDKAAVLRFHSSLRRSSQPQVTKETAIQQRHGSSCSPYRSPTVQSECGYGPSCDMAVEDRAMGGASRRLVMEKPKPIETTQPMRLESATNTNQQRQRKTNGGTTPAEFKSEPSSRGSKSVTAITPLVFSRQSSMDSLDSCEQHSVRSTVYSEYSQLPTGLPSPSELPDSPTSTLPPTTMGQERRKVQSEQQQRSASLEDRRGADGRAGGTTASSTKDDEERPKVYGKEHDHKLVTFNAGQGLWKTPPPPIPPAQQEFESNKLSASSSLSALTIDSDCKPKTFDVTIGGNERLRATMEQLGFQDCNSNPTSAFQNDQQNAASADLCPELHECILAGRPSPKTMERGQKGHRSNAKSPTTPRNATDTKRTQVDSGNMAVDEEGEADLRYVMQSAMPKPKTGRCKQNNPNNNVRIISPRQSGNSNVGIAKPILRSSSSTNTNCQQTAEHVSAGRGAERRMNREPQDENIMERSEELLQCIAMGMPKPKSSRKSKSLDRRGQRHQLSVALVSTVERGSGATMRHAGDEEESKAILLLSGSSALMNSAATTERVKDATALFDSASQIGIRSLPVARIAPEPQQSTDNNTAATRHDDSLSEDNYAHILDDSFSVKPEDVDIDSINDEEWTGAVDNENLLEPGPLLSSPTELMIDCDAFSNATHSNATCPPTGPRIVKDAPTQATVDYAKPIRGGQRQMQPQLASALAAPKMAVRTTKATELRAKKTQQQCSEMKLKTPTMSGNCRSRSMSPAMNSGVVPLPIRRNAAERTIVKTPPANRARHHSNGPDGQSSDECGQIGEAKKTTNIGRQQTGVNVRRKIECFQKREAAMDGATWKGTNEKRGNTKVQQTGQDEPSSSRSGKGQEGKRAVVTTV